MFNSNKLEEAIGIARAKFDKALGNRTAAKKTLDQLMAIDQLRLCIDCNEGNIEGLTSAMGVCPERIRYLTAVEPQLLQEYLFSESLTEVSLIDNNHVENGENAILFVYRDYDKVVTIKRGLRHDFSSAWIILSQPAGEKTYMLSQLDIVHSICIRQRLIQSAGNNMVFRSQPIYIPEDGVLRPDGNEILTRVNNYLSRQMLPFNRPLVGDGFIRLDEDGALALLAGLSSPNWWK